MFKLHISILLMFQCKFGLEMRRIRRRNARRVHLLVVLSFLKRSVGKLPLVDLISKCLGYVYVQRESKSSNIKGVSALVNERIQDAHKDKSTPIMMLFPEGTTTNGDYILP